MVEAIRRSCAASSELHPLPLCRTWTGYAGYTAGSAGWQLMEHTKISYGWINGLNGFDDGKGYVADQNFGNTGRHIWGMDALAKVQAAQLPTERHRGSRVRGTGRLAE